MENYEARVRGMTSASVGFLESNSLVAKVAFLILVVVGFVIVLRVGTYVVTYLFKPTQSPHLFDGMVDAKQMIIFNQDPSEPNSVVIRRSVNERDGIEFSWSVWMYINSMQTNAGIYKHVFSKGNNNVGENGIIQPNNAPGLYIAPDTNELLVIMNTYDVINEEVRVPDIPLNKWVNVILRCQNTTLDVFINGVVTRSVQLSGVPKQNYGNVYVAMNGGFDGYVSNLWYFDYAVTMLDIQRVLSAGANTHLIGSSSSAMNSSTTNYLSLRWFLNSDTV